MSLEKNYQQIGVEAFAQGQVPDSAALTDVASTILATSANRAYVTVELITISAGQVHIARGQTALADKGTSLQLNVPQKFFGAESISAICETAAATGTVIFQDFLHATARPITYL